MENQIPHLSCETAQDKKHEGGKGETWTHFVAKITGRVTWANDQTGEVRQTDDRNCFHKPNITVKQGNCPNTSRTSVSNIGGWANSGVNTSVRKNDINGP